LAPWVSVVDPELKLPETVIVYVPAGVPGFPPPPPPPQDDSATAMLSKITAAPAWIQVNRLFRLNLSKLISTAKAALKPKAATGSFLTLTMLIGMGSRNPCDGAVVVIVTVVETADAPFRVRELGETLHIDRPGTPPQASVTF